MTAQKTCEIVGSGRANPTAMLLSAAMMLQWLSEKFEDAEIGEEGRRLTRAVDRAYAEGQLHPVETGGTDGTAQVTDAVVACLKQDSAPAVGA